MKPKTLDRPTRAKSQRYILPNARALVASVHSEGVVALRRQGGGVLYLSDKEEVWSLPVVGALLVLQNLLRKCVEEADNGMCGRSRGPQIGEVYSLGDISRCCLVVGRYRQVAILRFPDSEQSLVVHVRNGIFSGGPEVRSALLAKAKRLVRFFS
jgi:hypothetical protein